MKDKCKQISIIQCLGHTTDTDKYSAHRREEAEGDVVNSQAEKGCLVEVIREMNL